MLHQTCKIADFMKSKSSAKDKVKTYTFQEILDSE